MSTTTAGTGYTGAVTWASSGGALGGTFAAATVYTATITLTPTSGYTLTGVSANFFTVAGATPVTNLANAGVITAVFPATTTTISAPAIAGVTAPVRGATPVSTTTAGTGYTGAVTWTSSGVALVGNFAPETTYTATITLTPTSGYTLTGVGANFFTVAGVATPAANLANAGVITAVFPATAAYIVGDTGPGGGIVFYVAPTFFTQVGATGSMCSTNCKYLEFAPTNAWVSQNERVSACSVFPINPQGIGTGYANTLALAAVTCENRAITNAADLSLAYRGPNNLSDWFLPSRDELTMMCRWARGLNGTFVSGQSCAGGIGIIYPLRGGLKWAYQSSSTTTEYTSWIVLFNYGEYIETDTEPWPGDMITESDPFIRPVRAF